MSPTRHRLSLCIAIMLAFAAVQLSACASKQKPAKTDYSGQAQYAYDQAKEAAASSEFLEAVKLFNHVRTKFPYSDKAALASLGIGDVYFEQDQMPSAIEAYKRFIQLHPTHPEIPYARYKIALAYYKQLPGDWFFMPPAYEKDLASTDEAQIALKRFLDNHPNSTYAEEVAQKLSEVRGRLAEHEFFVGTFYLEREEPRSAAQRFAYLLENYPGLGFDEEALFLLGKSFLLLRDLEKATNTWSSLVAQYPDHPFAIEASRYMQRHGLNARSSQVAR